MALVTPKSDAAIPLLKTLYCSCLSQSKTQTLNSNPPSPARPARDSSASLLCAPPQLPDLLPFPIVGALTASEPLHVLFSLLGMFFS